MNEYLRAYVIGGLIAFIEFGSVGAKYSGHTQLIATNLPFTFLSRPVFFSLIDKIYGLQNECGIEFWSNVNARVIYLNVNSGAETFLTYGTMVALVKIV